MPKEIWKFVSKNKMSEKNKNRKKELEDFLRYSQDQMSEEERNAFEKSLQQG